MRRVATPTHGINNKQPFIHQGQGPIRMNHTKHNEPEPEREHTEPEHTEPEHTEPDITDISKESLDEVISDIYTRIEALEKTKTGGGKYYNRTISNKTNDKKQKRNRRSRKITRRQKKV